MRTVDAKRVKNITTEPDLTEEQKFTSLVRKKVQAGVDADLAERGDEIGVLLGAEPGTQITIEVGEPTLGGSFDTAKPTPPPLLDPKRGYNVLHDWNSYNYIFTLTSLTMDQCKDTELASNFDRIFNNNRGQETNEFYIVLRSGGYKRKIGNSDANVQAFNDTLSLDLEERTQALDEVASGQGSGLWKQGEAKGRDLFIDDVNIACAVGLSDAMGGGNATSGSFKVTEPYSVAGFYEELYNASRFAGHQDYIGAPFLLTIDFVGHKIVNADRQATLITSAIPKTRRHFPIVIRGSSMKVTEAGATYDVNFTALNFQAGNPGAITLSSNIDSPKQNNPTVGSVLYHLFDRMNTIEMEQMLEKKTKAGSEKQINEVVAKTTKSAEFKTASSTKSLEVAPFLPHRYAVWFPRNYSKAGGDSVAEGVVNNTGAPGSGSALNFKYFNTKIWQEQASFTLADQEQKNFVETFRQDATFSNPFAEAEMQGGTKTFSGFYAVKRLDEEVDRSNKDIEAKVKSLNDKSKEVQDATREAEELRKDLIREIQIYYKPGDAELKQFFDETSKGENGFVFPNLVGQAKSTFDFDNWNRVPIDDADPEVDEATDEVEIDGGAEKVGNRLNELRAKYYNQLKTIETLKKELNALQGEGKTLEERKSSIFEKEFTAYGEDRESWQFKKGTTLEQNIHTIITDSYYASVVDDDAETFAKTGFIKWYRIEKYAIPYGYDTYYNREVYEIHFCVQPFYVHYSQLPGNTEVFSYDEARKFAVREYNYIFTGKNLDVMNFNLDFNNLFFAAGQYRPKNDPEASTSTITEKKVYKRPSAIVTAAMQNRVGNKKSAPVQEKDSTTANTSTPNNANQTARMLNDTLFNNPGEKALLKAEIGIIGDPVYLVGSGIGNRAILRADEMETDAGEMNSFSREVDILFNFSSAIDYPTADELKAKSGQFTMKLNQSVYSGLYKLLRVESNFSQGVFSQTLICARRPNQEEDYMVPRPKVVSKPEDQVDETQGPAPDEQTKKLDKPPQVKIGTQEELERFQRFNPSGVDGLSATSVVEIAPAAIGFSPNAFGGSLMTSVAEAQSIASAVSSGNASALSNFVPGSVQSAIEANASGISPVQQSTLLTQDALKVDGNFVKSSSGNVLDGSGNPIRSA